MKEKHICAICLGEFVQDRSEVNAQQNEVGVMDLTITGCMSVCDDCYDGITVDDMTQAWGNRRAH